jgi:hypothetical protein
MYIKKCLLGSGKTETFRDAGLVSGSFIMLLYYSISYFAVHNVRPSDVKVVTAVGDGFMVSHSCSTSIFAFSLL